MKFAVNQSFLINVLGYCMHKTNCRGRSFFWIRILVTIKLLLRIDEAFTIADNIHQDAQAVFEFIQFQVPHARLTLELLTYKEICIGISGTVFYLKIAAKLNSSWRRS